MKRRTFMSFVAAISATGVPAVSFAGMKDRKERPSFAIDQTTNFRVRTIFRTSRTDVKALVLGIGDAGQRTVKTMALRGLPNTDVALVETKVARCAPSAKEVLGNSEPAQYQSIVSALIGHPLLVMIASDEGWDATTTSEKVATVARSLGILTVALVVTPSQQEGYGLNRRLAPIVDSITFGKSGPDLLPGGQDSEALYLFTRGITDFPDSPIVGVDFEDVRFILAEAGKLAMGFGSAAGANRAKVAANSALQSPAFEISRWPESTGFLVNITASKSLRMREINDVMTVVRQVASDSAAIIFCATFDDLLGDTLRVTIYSTESRSVAARTATIQPIEDGRFDIPAFLAKRAEG